MYIFLLQIPVLHFVLAHSGSRLGPSYVKGSNLRIHSKFKFSDIHVLGMGIECVMEAT